MRARLAPILGTALFLALGWATLRGYSGGGQDFRVFHHAARLVLDGNWDLLYVDGPDRYLYAPGFALFLAPLAALPFPIAHTLWLAATLAAFAATLRILALRAGAAPTLLAAAFSFRAVAIDLRYGQVNLAILAAAVWALDEWNRRAETARGGRLLASWFLLGFATVAKIYPIALFLFPACALVRGDSADRRAALRVAGVALAAAAAILGVPYLFHAYPPGGLEAEWISALSRKGLPTDTHNQSFSAFLARWVAGEPFRSLRLGETALRLGAPGSPARAGTSALSALALGFALAIAAAFARLAWRSARSGEPRGREAGWFGIALCFLPAHLVWKSYFALGLPMLAAVFAAIAAMEPPARRRWTGAYAAVGAFLAISPSLPAVPAAWIESASPFLWAHLFAAVAGARITGARTSARPASRI